MLLTGYRKEIFRPECNPGFQSLHCIAHLDDAVGPVLPYLNAALGGYVYLKDPPAVTFKVHGKLITVHGEKIAVNGLRDEAEADKILEWIRQEINETWDMRDQIKPSYEGIPQPKILEVLRLLPRTNCRQCGQPTCMVFASLIAQGAKGPGDCTPLPRAKMEALQEYLAPFQLDR